MKSSCQPNTKSSFSLNVPLSRSFPSTFIVSLPFIYRMERERRKGAGGEEKNKKQVKTTTGQITGVTHTSLSRCSEVVLATAIPRGLGLAWEQPHSKRREERTSKGVQGERPTNFKKCTCDRPALMCDTRYPCGLFGNQIWNNFGKIRTLLYQAPGRVFKPSYECISLGLWKICFWDLVLSMYQGSLNAF